MKLAAIVLFIAATLQFFVVLTDSPTPSDPPKATGQVIRPSVMAFVTHVDGNLRENRQHFDGLNECNVQERAFMREVPRYRFVSNVVAVCSVERVA